MPGRSESPLGDTATHILSWQAFITSVVGGNGKETAFRTLSALHCLIHASWLEQLLGPKGSMGGL